MNNKNIILQYIRIYDIYIGKTSSDNSEKQNRPSI